MESIKVHVTGARHLPSTFLRAPSAIVELHTIPGFPAIASSQPIPSNTNPVWDFTHEYEVSCYPPHRLSFVVIDSTRPKAAPLGGVSLEIIYPITSGWFALSEDGNDSAELFVTIVCKNACERRASLSRLINHTAHNFDVEKSAQNELRQVADSPGFLFRSGELVVKIKASGVPQSLWKPHLKLSLKDQILKADETESSAAEWEKIQREEQAVQRNERLQTDQAGEATDGMPVDEQGKSEFKTLRDEDVEADYRTSRENGQESKADKSVRGVPFSRTWNGFGQAQQAMYNEKRSSIAFGAIKLGTAPRKLLRGGRRAGLDKFRSFTRTKQVPQAQMGGFTGSSRSAADNDSKEGVLARQNSEPSPVFDGDSESAVPDSKSKDDLSLRAAVEAERHETTGLPSGLRASVSYDFDKPSADRKSRPTLPLIPFTSSSKPRRDVDFGAVKFAIFADEVPENLRIQLIDRNSKLPGPMNMFIDQTMNLEGATELLCSCGEECHAHILQYQTSSRGPRNNRIVLHMLVRMRTWKPKAKTNDVTRDFLNLLPRMNDVAQDFKETFPEAEQLTYLFIGGLFTDHYPTYFEKNIQYLQETLCLPRVQSVPIHTEGSVQRNTKTIRDSVLKTCRGAKSVLLIGHSKGGVDATAVIQIYPEVIPFLYGIITFQAPFGGTFLVDFVERSRLAVSAIKNIIEGLWKGDQESVQDMCYSSRLSALGVVSNISENSSQAVDGVDARETHTRNPVHENAPTASNDINVFERIPIVSFGSFASFDILGIRSAATAAGIASMSPAAKIVLDRTGFLCDGLVIANDARIPFSDFVSLHDMMHTEPALYVPGTNYPPGQLTASALVLLFEKARRRKGPNVSEVSAGVQPEEQRS